MSFVVSWMMIHYYEFINVYSNSQNYSEKLIILKHFVGKRSFLVNSCSLERDATFTPVCTCLCVI